MTPEILTAIIGALGAVLGSFFGIIASAKLTNYRLEQLEHKVDRHNNLIERTFNLEAREDVLETRINALEENIRNESN